MVRGLARGCPWATRSDGDSERGGKGRRKGSGVLVHPGCPWSHLECQQEVLAGTLSPTAGPGE